MIGNHAISLLADAWEKGIKTVDPKEALDAYYHEATNKGPWGPMSITMRALTSKNDEEIKRGIESLRKTHAGTGFMHESFHKNDPANFSRIRFLESCFGKRSTKSRRF